MSLFFRVVKSGSDIRMEDVQVLLDMRHREFNKRRKHKPGRELAWIQTGFFYLLAYSQDGPVGFVHVQRKPFGREEILDMHEFYTIPKMRRKGVAKKLMIYLGNVADKLGISRMRIPNYTHRMQKIVDWAMSGERVYRRAGNVNTYSEGVAHVVGKNAIHIVRNPRTQRRVRPH